MKTTDNPDLNRIVSLAWIIVAIVVSPSLGMAQGNVPFAGPKPAPIYTLGFDGTDIPGLGVQISNIDPNGPLSRMRTPGQANAQTMVAEAGDILLAINGVPVASRAALEIQLGTLAQSRGICLITLRDVRSGVNQNFEITAAVAPGGQSIAPPAITYSLQISGEEVPGQGIRIISIIPGGAAAKLRDPLDATGTDIYLDPGDLITAINGMPIRTAAEYQSAMAALQSVAGRMQLTIVDVRTGQARTLKGVAAATVNNQPVNNNNNNNNNNPPVDTGIRKVHLIICGQSGTSQEGFNSCIRKSLSDMDQLLTRLDGQFIASKTILRDADCNADSIRNRLQNLQVSPSDTIFFFYTGHGAHDANGHFLQLSATRGVDMPRREIVQLIQRHNARLSLIITESCNATAAPKMVAEQRTARNVINGLTRLEDLLLNYRGLIDLNSSDTGQFGWGNPVHGGYFSKFLVEKMLILSPDQGGWNNVINDISQSTNQFYQQNRNEEISFNRAPPEMRTQTALTPKIYQLQVQRDPYQVNIGQREMDTTYSTFRPVPGG